MDVVSINILLEYLYKRYIVTFLLCLVGAFIKESTLSTAKVKKISVLRILSPSIFSSVLICALSDYIKVPFSVYTGICVLTGMWSYPVLKLFMSIKFIQKILKAVIANITGPLGKALTDISEDYYKEELEKAKKSNKKSKKGKTQPEKTEAIEDTLLEEIEDDSLK